MTMDQLLEIVTPPATPQRSIPPGQWPAIDAQLGFSPPGEYKEFIATYGCGALADFFYIFCPVTPNRHLSLFEASATKLEAYEQLETHESMPFPLFANGEGLFPYGMTDNGDVLFWFVEAHKVRPLTIVNEARGPIWEEYKLSFANFLVQALQNKLNSQILPNDWQEDEWTVAPIL